MRDSKERLIWLNGELVPVGEARVNVLSPTSQFGLNVFEGVRCYWNEAKNQLYAFRLHDHIRRLKRSQRMMMMEDRYTPEELEQALLSVVRANAYREDIAVRQTLFVDGFGSWSAAGPVGMFIAPIPSRQTSAEYNKVGLRCRVSSWRRLSENQLSPRVKCGANYINSRMAHLEALRDGYDAAIFLGEQGKVAEGTGSCLFIVRDGALATPLLSDSVLESITRDTVLRMARELGIETRERTVDRTELYICDEAFLCGSSMGITPVLSVDGFSIGDEAGSITSALRQAYARNVRGEDGARSEWLTPVYES